MAINNTYCTCPITNTMNLNYESMNKFIHAAEKAGLSLLQNKVNCKKLV